MTVSTASVDESKQLPRDDESASAHSSSRVKRRKLKFQCLSEATAEVDRLASGSYSRAGTWSLEQVLQHLNKTMLLAFDEHGFLLPSWVRPIVKIAAVPLMRKGVQFPSGAQAPSFLLPSDAVDLEEEVRKFAELAARIEDPSSVLQEYHPLLGKINHEQWNVMQRWHAAHHLSFIVPKPQLV